mmetsp:Transcript_36259/g.86034  ORF Transcript_36259/g.86034 Transcript_36259/m.86034 type:complete len:362 (+) Transcript_36259:310-1395(+)
MRELVKGRLQAFSAAHDPSTLPQKAIDLLPLPLHPLLGHSTQMPRLGDAQGRRLPRGSSEHLGALRPHALCVQHTGLGCPVTEHEPFEQAVGRKAVRAMQPGAGDLPGRKEPDETRLAAETGLHAAAHVVLRRHNRDGVVADVDPAAEAVPRNVGEVRLQHAAGLVRDVEPHVRFPPAHHLGVDGPRHNIAGRQLLPVVVAGHEPVPIEVEEQPALPADGLRDEEPAGPRARGVEARRVELHKLHVGDRGARPVRHGDAVAGGHMGVCGVGVDLAAAAAREECHGSAKAHQGHVPLVKHIHSKADIRAPDIVGDKVDDHVVLEELNVGVPPRRFQQGPLNLGACHVSCMDDSAVRVATLTG